MLGGRASRTEFWSFFLLSVLLFLPLGYSMIDVDSQPAGFYVSPSLQILLYAAHPQDALILLAHSCFNPTFYFFYQSGELSMLSLELLAAVAGLNILFNLPVAVRRNIWPPFWTTWEWWPARWICFPSSSCP